VDVVFIALHGVYGEDGTIQRLCELHHIPFTGSNSFPSRVAFNKDATKRAVNNPTIKMPRHVRIMTDDLPGLPYIVSAIKETFGPSYVIKPLMSGSSQGVTIVTDPQLLESSIRAILATEEQCMVEEHISGIETTCGILENFRGEKHYILPPIEIRPPAERTFFDYQSKYDGSTEEICPARFDLALREKIGALALLVHRTLNLSQYSRSDMIVRGDDVYFLEVNTLPGLTDESLFPKAAAAVGLPYNHLITHLVETATVNN
jgi:D-alanine-D-alanine ligase